MRVLYHDVQRLPEDVEVATGARATSRSRSCSQRLTSCSVHVNLTADTHHLIDARALAPMRPTAVLVNTSRGPVVDTDALATALRDGTIFGAALDVTDPEPLPADHPLLAMDNCLVVPHIASASRDTRGMMAAMAAANLLAGVRGSACRPRSTRRSTRSPDDRSADGA